MREFISIEQYEHAVGHSAWAVSAEVYSAVYAGLNGRNAFKIAMRSCASVLFFMVSYRPLDTIRADIARYLVGMCDSGELWRACQEEEQETRERLEYALRALCKDELERAGVQTCKQ